MNTNQEFRTLCHFAKTVNSNDGYDLPKRQLKALWTAYNLHLYRTPSYRSYDDDLNELWNYVCENQTFPWRDESDFDNFDSFMMTDLW